MSEIVCFDIESTGIDVENDRIIQAFVGVMGEDGEWAEKHEWLIDPGIEIPAGASDVHGYTTERIRAEGRKDDSRAVGEIVERLEALCAARPLVIYNASFDVSMLTCEAIRHGHEWDIPEVVIDPLVLDKAKDKYRKGSRKLVDVAPVYGVPVEGGTLHDASFDCLLAGRIALKMLESWRAPLSRMMQYQVDSARQQRASLQDYFERSGKREPNGSKVVVRQGWPAYDGIR